VRGTEKKMPETFTNSLLKIQVTDENDAITVTWYGKSIMRNPGGFIAYSGESCHLFRRMIATHSG